MRPSVIILPLLLATCSEPALAGDPVAQRLRTCHAVTERAARIHRDPMVLLTGLMDQAKMTPVDRGALTDTCRAYWAGRESVVLGVRV